MTVCCAIVSAGGAWIGADRLAIIGDYDMRVVCAEPKIMRIPGAILGFAGSNKLIHRVVESLRDESPPPPWEVAAEVIGDDTDDDSEFECLIAAPNQLVWFSTPDFAPVALASAHAAIGAGAMAALGSLESTTGQDPQQRIKTAIESAERWCPSVGGGADYMKIPP